MVVRIIPDLSLKSCTLAVRQSIFDRPATLRHLITQILPFSKSLYFNFTEIIKVCQGKNVMGL